MHVAIVDEELPYPPNSGKRIRTFQLLSRLARRHRITYVCHRNADPREAVQAEVVFHDLGIETVVVDRAVPPKSGPGFHARLAANLFSIRPFSVTTHSSPALSRAIRDIAARHQVDLWQAEWTPYVETLRALGDVRRLAVALGVESQIWRRYYENETNLLRRWYIGLQWRKFERFERRAFGEVDRVVAVSREDSVAIRDQFGARHVDVVENGVDTRYFQPDSPGREPGRILFMGSLDWRPNLDAVDQLLGRIFPAVRAESPDARLCLVGRNPPASLWRRVGATPGVEMHANVEDVRPFLACAAVMVVPLRIGGGSRLKILEAFAAGLPVVSTRIGAEGLAVRDGEHLILAETCDDIAAALLHRVPTDDALPRMTRQARQLVEARYDWDILADQLDAIWRDTAAVVLPSRPNIASSKARAERVKV